MSVPVELAATGRSETSVVELQAGRVAALPGAPTAESPALGVRRQADAHDRGRRQRRVARGPGSRAAQSHDRNSVRFPRIRAPRKTPILARRVAGVLAEQLRGKGRLRAGNLFALSGIRASRGRDKPVVTGYRAENSITVETGAIGIVGALIDAALGAGASRINYLDFALDDETQARSEAIARATLDAQAQAESLARSLGRQAHAGAAGPSARPRRGRRRQFAARAGRAKSRYPRPFRLPTRSSSLTLRTWCGDAEAWGHCAAIRSAVRGRRSRRTPAAFPNRFRDGRAVFLSARFLLYLSDRGRRLPSSSREAFAAEHTSVVAVSIDDVQTHLRWARELGGISYPLLADEGGTLARAYGVFDESAGMAMRATFILDSKRTIVYCVACPVNVGRSVSETLRVVRALRSGRMCPADWEPDRQSGPADHNQRFRVPAERAWRPSIQPKRNASSSVSPASAKSFSGCRTEFSPRPACSRA